LLDIPALPVEEDVFLRPKSIVFILILAFSGMIYGCASGPEQRKRVSYRTSAKENFIKGKKAFDDEDFLEAIEFFKFVKNKFPYSKYATEADLYLAECHFGRERYIEAADAYLNFAKLHPKNEKMPYALFQIGNCYFKRIPDDWWFTPPAYEMDQAETHRAIREIGRYLKRFPKHENAKEAKELLQQCLKRMGDQTHYVMNFYFKRGHHRGVLWRADEILSKYSGLGFDEEALFKKAQAQIELEDPAGAKASLQQLISRFPSGEYAEDAKEKLSELAASPPKPKEDSK
jgi:outer membrane protein assembly factor BamD